MQCMMLQYLLLAGFFHKCYTFVLLVVLMLFTCNSKNNQGKKKQALKGWAQNSLGNCFVLAPSNCVSFILAYYVFCILQAWQSPVWFGLCVCALCFVVAFLGTVITCSPCLRHHEWEMDQLWWFKSSARLAAWLGPVLIYVACWPCWTFEPRHITAGDGWIMMIQG